MYKEFTSIFHEESIVYEFKGEGEAYYARKNAIRTDKLGHKNATTIEKKTQKIGRNVINRTSHDGEGYVGKANNIDKAKERIDKAKNVKKNFDARLEKKADKKSAKHESGLLDITLI